jgi:uncharacterized protein (TIGR03437 family)
MYVITLLIDRTTPATLYAGTGGGAFKSTNGGTSWTTVNSGRLGGPVTALAMDSSTPATLYAVTSAGFILKSTNGGTSWTETNFSLPSITTSISALAIDPSNPATLYAGTYYYGVMKSTDIGRSWTAVNSGLTTTDVRALVIDPSAPATLYAAVYGRGVFKSTNGGTTWRPTGASSGAGPPAGGPAVGAGAILQAFLGGDRISPGTWVEIYGENFAAQAKDWSGLFQGNQAPTSIDGVRVNIDNKPAYLSFISPTQINVQVPDGVGVGLVTVEVVTPAGMASTTVHVSAVSPALLTTPAFQVGGRQYVAALFATELNQERQIFVGRPNLIPSAVFRPAKPGEVLTIFAVGCGPTNPPSPSGQVVQGLRQLVNSPQVLFGQTAAQAAGFLSAGAIGLCQFNVTVPNVAGDSSGDVPISVTIGGVRNAQNLFTTVQP